MALTLKFRLLSIRFRLARSDDEWNAIFVRRDSAVKLVDDLAGESPVSADCPVGAVVISSDGTGDQAVGSLDVNALEGWT